MAIPALFYFTSASQVLPVLAALRYRRVLTTSRRLIVLFCLLGLTHDAIALQFALRKINNLWLGYITAPILVIIVLLALSYWHTDPRFRRILRLLPIVLVLAVMSLVVVVEDVSQHSLVRRPMESFLVVTASLGTLILLTWKEQGQLLHRDWFWICLGLALRYGGGFAMDPLARLLVPDSPDLVISAMKVRQIINAVAYVIIARGIWCPILPQRSSGHSSPVSSPSFSSSPR